MMMAGTLIDCCVSNCAQVEFVINVNKSGDIQFDYRVMTHVSKTSANQMMMDGTSDREDAGRVLAAPEFGPRNLYANLSGNGVIDASFLASDLDDDRLSQNET
jgi:uncharacterized protein (DUF736 family)